MTSHKVPLNYKTAKKRVPHRRVCSFLDTVEMKRDNSSAAPQV